MIRYGLLFAAAFALAGCGSDGPSVSQVTVTLTQGGTIIADGAVVESAGMDGSTPTGIIATQNTNSSGQTTFAVPASTSTGSLCFSARRIGSSSSNCATLNSLSPAITLDL